MILTSHSYAAMTMHPKMNNDEIKAKQIYNCAIQAAADNA